jgi:succinate-acetate transporter protein
MRPDDGGGSRPPAGLVKLGGNMSVSEDRTAQPAVQPAAAASGIADPAPLGLAAFALTTFLLSASNANWMSHSTGAAFLGYAFFYGGLVQLLAGMWEFRNRNVFGATAFGSYGGFWLGLGAWVEFVKLPALAAARPATLAATVSALNHDVGWILLAFAIFNTYMLLLSAQVNMAIFGVFLTLEITEIILFIGNFVTKTPALPPDPATSSSIIRIGGYIGILTALVAWYASAAGVMNGLKGKEVFPVGKPLFKLGG